MNKILYITICAMLCAYLVACGTATFAPPPEEPLISSSPVPEVESVIEPVEMDEPSSRIEEDSLRETAPEEAEEESGPVPEPPVNSYTPQQSGDGLERRQKQQPETPLPEETGALDREKVELELLKLINAEREAAGVEALGVEENMRFAARMRSEEALESFSHTRPDGTPYNTAFDEAGFSYAGKWHGENIVSLHFMSGELDEQAAAAEIFKELKSSRGHYRNMISENFLQSGVGVTVSYSGNAVSVVSAQLFSSV